MSWPNKTNYKRDKQDDCYILIPKVITGGNTSTFPAFKSWNRCQTLEEYSRIQWDDSNPICSVSLFFCFLLLPKQSAMFGFSENGMFSVFIFHRPHQWKPCLVLSKSIFPVQKVTCIIWHLFSGLVLFLFLFFSLSLIFQLKTHHHTHTNEF